MIKCMKKNANIIIAIEGKTMPVLLFLEIKIQKLKQRGTYIF